MAVYRSKERIKKTSEIFTPPELVEEILDKLPRQVWTDPEKTFLEPSCGNGNFLVAIRNRLLAQGHSEENIFSRLYGVDLMADNIQETKDRLDPNQEYRDIIDRNIMCADALTYHFYFDGTGEKEPVAPLEKIKIEDLFNDI